MGILGWTGSCRCIYRNRALARTPGSLDIAARSVTSCTSTTARNEQQAQWQIQKKALEKKFGSEKWQPRKRLSPDALDGLRALHAQDAHKYSTQALAEQFKVSPEAVRRILKSKWRPRDDEQAGRQTRWIRRGQRVWEEWMNKGMKAPKKWRSPGSDCSGQLQDIEQDAVKHDGKIRSQELEFDIDAIGKSGQMQRVTRPLSNRIL